MFYCCVIDDADFVCGANFSGFFYTFQPTFEALHATPEKKVRRAACRWVGVSELYVI